MLYCSTREIGTVRVFQLKNLTDSKCPTPWRRSCVSLAKGIPKLLEPDALCPHVPFPDARMIDGHDVMFSIADARDHSVHHTMVPDKAAAMSHVHFHLHHDLLVIHFIYFLGYRGPTT